MWLFLLLFPCLFVLIFFCGGPKKRPKGSRKDSVSSESGRRDLPKQPQEDKRQQGSDVEQRQSSYSGTTAPSNHTPAMKTEQTQKPQATAAKATEEQMRPKGFQVEPTQDSEKSRKEVASAKEKKTTKEKQPSIEKAAVENAPGSSADDSDTFKHVMSIRDVVKKDKAMKQKAK